MSASHERKMKEELTALNERVRRAEDKEEQKSKDMKTQTEMVTTYRKQMEASYVQEKKRVQEMSREKQDLTERLNAFQGQATSEAAGIRQCRPP